MAEIKTQCYAHFLRPLIRVLKAHNLDSSSVLEAANLDRSVLQEPYQIITHHQLAICFSHAAALEAPKELAFDIGQAIGLADKSALGHAQLASKTLRHIMALGQKYMPMFMPLLQWDMLVKAKSLSLRYKAQIPEALKKSLSKDSASKLEHFLIDMMLSMHLHQAARLDENLQADLLQLPAAKGNELAIYDRIFKGEIVCGGRQSIIRFPMSAFDVTLPNYDQRMVDNLEQQCIKLKSALQKEPCLVEQVTLAFKARPGHFPSLEQLAEKLELSTRTLRRRLNEKNSNYQSLLQEAKQDIASDYLRSSELPISEIAELCGFSETRNFVSMFKRWQQCTPSEYRLQYRNIASSE